MADQGDGLRWFHAIPRAKIHYKGVVWDFDADTTDAENLRYRWEDVVECVMRELETFNPPILDEHVRNGRSNGLSRRVVELSKEEANALGVPLTAPAGLFIGADLNEDAAADYDAGKIPYVSPGMVACKRDEKTGEIWPFYLSELSCVSVPHIQTDQVPVPDMRHAQMKDAAMTYADNLRAMCAEHIADPEAAEKFAEELMKLIEEIRHTPEADPEAVVIEAAEADKPKDPEVAAMRAEVAKLRAEMREARVDAALAGRKVSPETRAALASIANDPAKLTAAMADFAPAPAAAPASRLSVVPTQRATSPAGPSRTSAPVGGAGTGVDPTPEQFANMSDDDQCKYSEAWCKRENVKSLAMGFSALRTGRTPQKVVAARASGIEI